MLDGGENDAEVAPEMAVPPVFELVVFTNHWYENVPLPPVATTEREVIFTAAVFWQ